jgi:virginiamycin B lyase
MQGFAVKALLLVSVAATGAAQDSPPERTVTRPGVKEFQVPFASLKPQATFKIGEDADWVQITADAVWVTSSKPASVHRIDPRNNKEAAVVAMPGEPCAGLEFAFGSLWVPICGNPNSLVRVDAATNRIAATLPFGPAGPEGGIAASRDSIWIVTDNAGTLLRIDPVTNKVRQNISIAPGSFNPIFFAGAIWITGGSTNVLTALDASSGAALGTITVGPKPRFLAAGGGSVWTLNQGDGTVTRVDAKSRSVTDTIALGIPGHGGDIAWGAGAVWATVFDVPLTAVDSRTNRIRRQWVGRGGDALRIGHNAIWLTDNKRGTLLRIPLSEALR